MKCRILTRTKDMSREEWLEKRKQGVGGSDVGAICGLNKWKSPIAVYLDKIGEMKHEKKESEAAYWGILMENVVAKEFQRRTGKKVRRKNSILQHKDYPWMIANIDRDIVGEDALLECKTVSAYFEDSWKGNKIPKNYIFQIQHYLAVTGYKRAYIAVLVGGNHFIWKEIYRDEEIIQYLIATEREFWVEHVEKKNPPAIDGAEATSESLNTMYSKAFDNEEIVLDFKARGLIETRSKLKDQERKIKKQINECDNKLKFMLGKHQEGKIDNFKVIWKNVNSDKLDKKGLKKDYPAIYEEYCNKTISRRLTIKEAN